VSTPKGDSPKEDSPKEDSPKEENSDSESMDDDSDDAAPPPSNEPFSIFGGPKPTGQPPTSLFGSKKDSSKTTISTETNKSSFSFGNIASQKQVTSPLSAPSDKTETPKKSQPEAPLPPDSTSRASYAPGDTSASSNVSKSSVDDAPPPDFTKKNASPEESNDAPLPPDFMPKKKSAPKEDDAPLPPDFMSKKKPVPPVEDAPLPPDFMAKPKKPQASASPEDAPLPPDFVKSKPKSEPAEEAVPVPDEDSDADESDFSDSGEEITHEETKAPSPKPSVESSFGAPSEKSFTGGLFSDGAKPAQGKGPMPRQLFGEIPKQPLLPPPGPAARSNREPHRSPSPTRGSSRKEVMFSERPQSRKESTSALHSRKTSLTQLAQRDGHLRKASDIAREEQERAHAAAQRQALEEEELALSDDDEDERLRKELAQPIEPADTLDPFLPHQNYMGETAKPGIPGQIELLYRDSNSMVDTAGINARSVKAYLAYHQPARESDDSKWEYILQSEHPNDILDVELFFKDIEKFHKMVATISRSLESQRVQGVEEKLQDCRDLLTKQVITLRSQFAGIRKTLDAHTDIGAILEAPLSAEQSTLQLDLRTAFTDIQAKLADIEQAVSLLRAQIADVPRANGASGNRPTVEAVIKTLNTMMTMTESKRTDVDVIESQMRRLGVEPSSFASPSREGSPFTTPRKAAGRVPMTPGSRGSFDGSAYHTPESASRGLNFRASIVGSAKQSRLRSVEGAGELDVAVEEATRWKTRSARRQHLVQNLKNAIDGKKTKVRGVDDL
jgi:nucleoporin NUP159